MAAASTPPEDIHAQAEELLPWYSTGQLDGKDRALVEKHLGTCVACQRQLRFDHKMIEEFETLDPGADRSWNRLRGRIEQQERRPALVGRALGGAWNLLRQPAVATLAAAQLAFVVVAGAMFLSLSRPDYHALSGPAQPSVANLIVVFRADASQKDVLKVLRASGASIVGGPTTADAYLLHIAPQLRGPALARIQSDPGVQMAQPIDGTAQ